ncbi:MAG: fasciclin domain-containing protein, partial [Gammaproteobacteria bacterium]
MNSMKRIISHALAASLVLFLAACSESGDGRLYKDDLPTVEAPPAPAPDPGPGNIVEVATEAGNFPTLLAAVEAAGLVDALADSSASLTVFAPTEEAFAALPEGTLDALLADPDALASVLTYHVLGSSVEAGSALDLAPTTVETLNGAKVAVTSRSDE